MVSLARASLVFEWRRYATAVLAVTFAGLLVIVQLALLLGLFSTVSAAVDESTADLWIGYRDTPSVDLGRPIRRDSDAAAWRHPEVTRIEPLVTAFGDLRRADGAPLLVTLNAIDSSDAALAFRRLLTPAQRAQLREPGAILVDAADLGKLQAAVGTVVEINGRRAHIAGVVEGIRAVGGITVLASHATVRRLAPETRDQVSYYLVGLRDPARAEQVVQQIGDGLGTARYSVWSAATLSQRSQAYWLLESGAGLGAGFASLLALLVGVVITSQTLSGAILASIREFAALRALGVAHGALRAVVLEQSLWIGLAGLALTGLLTAGILLLANHWRIAMEVPWWMAAGTALLMLAIALVSGLAALRPLTAAEPASLLR